MWRERKREDKRKMPFIGQAICAKVSMKFQECTHWTQAGVPRLPISALWTETLACVPVTLGSSFPHLGLHVLAVKCCYLTPATQRHCSRAGAEQLLARATGRVLENIDG